MSLIPQNLSFFAGDSKTTTIALNNDGDGSAFTPGADYHLIFTAKTSMDDDDSLALFQYSTGVGITHAGSGADVVLHPQDTRPYGSLKLYWDIQAENLLVAGDIRTVAIGTLSLKRDATRQTTTSVPIHTVIPGVPYTGPAAAWGNITGNLPDQTDLAAAMALKAPLANPVFTGTADADVVTANSVTASSVTGGTVTATGDLAVYGDSGINGYLVVDGDLSTGSTLTAAVGITSTTGNITASNGNIEATLGDVTAGGVLRSTNGVVVSGSGSIVAASGNITASSGSFQGAGTLLTGTGAGFTAGAANGLKSATTTVSISAATAPTAGQVLKATSSTTATWQAEAGGATTWSALTDKTTAPLPTDNTPLATALAGKAAMTYVTVAPNATVNVAVISAGGAASSEADLMLGTKAGGAVFASTNAPDGTSNGGDKRGPRAVDLQTNRATNTQVASGGSSVISGGSSNTASGFASNVPGGELCTASGHYSMAAGRRAKATQQGSMVMADSTNADVTSTSVDQFTFRFANGYSFLGGAAVFAGNLSSSSGTLGAGGQTWSGTTFTGPQAFTGQISSSGSTSTASSTNVLNMATNDARYAGVRLFSRLTADVDIVNSATLVPCGVSVVVPVAGVYKIKAMAFCQVLTGGSTAGGAVMNIDGVTFSNISGLDGKNASHTNVGFEYAKGVNSVASQAGLSSYALGSDFSDGNWYTSNYGGIWVYFDCIATLTAGTVTMKISQAAAHATLTRFRQNNTYLLIEKLS